MRKQSWVTRMQKLSGNRAPPSGLRWRAYSISRPSSWWRRDSGTGPSLRTNFSPLGPLALSFSPLGHSGFSTHYLATTYKILSPPLMLCSVCPHIPRENFKELKLCSPNLVWWFRGPLHVAMALVILIIGERGILSLCLFSCSKFTSNLWYFNSWYLYNRKYSGSANLIQGSYEPNPNPNTDATWSGSPPKSNQFLLVIHRSPS